MKDAIIEGASAIAILCIVILAFMFGGVLLSFLFVLTLGVWTIAIVVSIWDAVIEGLSSLFSRSEATAEREEK